MEIGTWNVKHAMFCFTVRCAFDIYKTFGMWSDDVSLTTIATNSRSDVGNSKTKAYSYSIESNYLVLHPMPKNSSWNQHCSCLASACCLHQWVQILASAGPWHWGEGLIFATQKVLAVHVEVDRKLRCRFFATHNIKLRYRLFATISGRPGAPVVAVYGRTKT